VKVSCPRCRREVPPDDVNVGTDTAYCRPCEEAFRLSGALPVAETPAAVRVDLGDPPAGAWFEETPGGFRVGGTTRSPLAIFFIPFTLVWAGLSLGGLTAAMIAKGEFIPGLALFAIPFVIGSVVLVSYSLLLIAGRTEVSVDRDDGSVFTGVGPLGRMRRFRWDVVDTAREGHALWNARGPMFSGTTIILEGRRRIRFGGLLREGRCYFVLEALKAMLAARDG